MAASSSTSDGNPDEKLPITVDSRRQMAASVWLISRSISASSARTPSASASSSRSRAERFMRAERDCRRVCSSRDRRLSLYGRSIRGRLYQCLLGFGEKLSIALEHVGGERAQRIAVFGVGQIVQGGA